MLSLPAGGTGKKIDPAKLFGEDKYDQYYQELLSEGRIDGDNVSPDERKEGVRAYRKGKIDFEKFVNKVLKVKEEVLTAPATAPATGQKKLTGSNFVPLALPPAEDLKAVDEDIPDDLDDLLNDIRAEQDDLQAKIDALLEEVRKEDDVDGLNARLDDLLDNIRTMNEIEEQQAEVKRQKEEKKKRKAKEKKLESFKKFIFAPIKKAFQPVQNFLQKFFDAVIKVVFAKAFIKLIDWFSDPENRSKIDSIFRFVKDFWPAIAAGFLLVGGALGLLGLKILGPIALAVGALVALTAGLAALAKALGFGPGEQEEKTEKALKDDFDGDKQKMIESLKEQKENLNLFEKMQGKGAEIDEQIYRLETGKTKSYTFGGDTPDTVDKDVTPPSADKNVTPSKDKASASGKTPFERATDAGYEVIAANDGYILYENKKTGATKTRSGTFRLQGETKEERFNNYFDGSDKFRTLKLNVGGVVPEEASLLQGLDQNFGDLPFIGGIIKTALGYEDRINYRNADPRLREMMGLTKSKPQPRGLQFRDLPGMSGGGGGTNALTNQPKVRSIPGILGDLFGGFRKKEIDPQTILGDTSPIGTDTVPAMLTPGETVLQVGARERMMDMIGVDPLMFNVGPNANKPKVSGRRQGFSGGGVVEVKGTGNTVEGTLKLKDSAGKQVGKTYGAISGTYAGMNVPQDARATTRNAPIPDGNYKLVGFEKHGPYPGLPGIGNWSTYIANSSGSIGSRSGLMLHSDIGSNGTLGCVGVELGGSPGTTAEKEFLQAYQQVNPDTIKIALGGGGGNSSEVASVDRKPSPDNSVKAAKLQPSQSASPRVSPSALAPSASKPAAGAQGTVPVPIPVGGQQKPPSPSSDVPSISSVDGHNASLYVMRSMYNLV